MILFKKLRLSLTVQFVVLALLVYATMSLVAVGVFHAGLTEAVDDQLKALARAGRTAVKTENGVLKLDDSAHTLQVETYHVEPAVQLWDMNKNLVGSCGAKGLDVYFPGFTEQQFNNTRVRSLSKPVEEDGKVIGFIQVQLVTGHRDRSLAEFLEAAFLTAPAVLLILGACGYVFAGRALKPVEETFSLQKQFLADAGHELKTPISIIQAACDNLSEDLKDNPQIVERLEVVMRSTERMQKLVSDLLLLTRTEQSKQSFEVKKVDLTMLLREVVGEFSDLADDKEIALIADKLDPATVDGDKDALHKVLSNLIKNSLRYTNAGGKITVSLTSTANTTTLRIEDTGIGIPEEALNKIFDRFYRVDQSRARTQGGSGLGLAIVKALVEKHNGTISVQSQLQKGSVFLVTLPLG